MKVEEMERPEVAKFTMKRQSSPCRKIKKPSSTLRRIKSYSDWLKESLEWLRENRKLFGVENRCWTCKILKAM